jgi:hypothetical protein
MGSRRAGGRPQPVHRSIVVQGASASVLPEVGEVQDRVVELGQELVRRRGHRRRDLRVGVGAQPGLAGRADRRRRRLPRHHLLLRLAVPPDRRGKDVAGVHRRQREVLARVVGRRRRRRRLRLLVLHVQQRVLLHLDREVAVARARRAGGGRGAVEVDHLVDVGADEGRQLGGVEELAEEAQRADALELARAGRRHYWFGPRRQLLVEHLAHGPLVLHATNKQTNEGGKKRRGFRPPAYEKGKKREKDFQGRTSN